MGPLSPLCDSSLAVFFLDLLQGQSRGVGASRGRDGESCKLTPGRTELLPLPSHSGFIFTCGLKSNYNRVGKFPLQFIHRCLVWARRPKQGCQAQAVSQGWQQLWRTLHSGLFLFLSIRARMGRKKREKPLPGDGWFPHPCDLEGQGGAAQQGRS